MPSVHELDRKIDFPKGTCDLEGPELNAIQRLRARSAAARQGSNAYNEIVRPQRAQCKPSYPWQHLVSVAHVWPKRSQIKLDDSKQDLMDVAHLTRGSRSRSWALYSFFHIRDSYFTHQFWCWSSFDSASAQPDHIKWCISPFTLVFCRLASEFLWQLILWYQ